MIVAAEDTIKIRKLRFELENAKYRLPANRIVSMTKEHKDILFKYNVEAVSFKLNGERFLWSFNRIVCGAHGPYIEFSKPMLAMQLQTTIGQEWRLSGKYSVKYLHLNPIGFPTVKIYHQLGTVSYADYQVDKYYVDFWEPLLTK